MYLPILSTLSVLIIWLCIYISHNLNQELAILIAASAGLFFSNAIDKHLTARSDRLKQCIEENIIKQQQLQLINLNIKFVDQVAEIINVLKLLNEKTKLLHDRTTDLEKMTSI